MASENDSPPRLAQALLHLLLPRADRYHVSGDFTECYHHLTQTRGRRRARCWYRWQVVKSIPAFLHRLIYGSTIMFSNYLKIALRTIGKSRLYAGISVAGLAIGMACCLIIASFIRHELRFDSFHEHSDRLYRINQSYESGGGTFTTASTMAPLAPALRQSLPTIEATARYFHAGRRLVRHGDHHFYETGVYWADADFLRLFSFPMLHGDANTALQAPNAIVLTRAAAQKYFGDAEAIGKTLSIDNSRDLTVTGVLHDVPAHSSLQFDFLLSLAGIEATAPWAHAWGDQFLRTFVLLQPEVAPATVEAGIAGVVAQHYSPRPPAHRLFLQPLARLHLYQTDGSPGLLYLLYVLAAVAVIILLIAITNYMNLATARSVQRIKEVGLRKVVGASRRQVVVQFLSESILLALLALPLAFGLAHLAAPAIAGFFADATGARTSLEITAGPPLLGGLALLALLVGIAGGLYPAVVVSRHQPAAVLKNAPGTGPQRSRLQRLLVIGQFVFSIFFMCCAGIVHDQVAYLKGRDLGYATQQIVSLRLDDPELQQRAPALKQALEQHSSVAGASLAASTPARFYGRSSSVVPELMSPDQHMNAHMFPVDYDYLETFDLQLVQGRNFDRERATDARTAVIINETAVARFGWQEPLGRKLRISGRGESSEVIGVVRDFHFQALTAKIEPAVLLIDLAATSTLSIRFQPGHLAAGLTEVRDQWQAFAPGFPLELQFMDEAVERMYRAHQLIFQFSRAFAIFAILIACLGLFGLAAFAAEQRTKEIGVRKVLGASLAAILALLAKDFIKLVMIAFVVAVPLAWLAMQAALQNFAYRTTIDPLNFVAVGAASFAIALLTVSYQSLRAGLSNPVKTLRSE